MKVSFNVDSCANIHSCKTETWDLSKEKDLKSFGFTEEEWLALSEEEKNEEVRKWADERMEMYFEEEK